MSVDFDSMGNWGLTPHIGAGIGGGVGGSAGPGGSVGSGFITPGPSFAIDIVGFVGDAIGISGQLSVSPHVDGSIDVGGGAGGKIGPTVGAGGFIGPTIGYTWKGPGNWINGIVNVVGYLRSL